MSTVSVDSKSGAVLSRDTQIVPKDETQVRAFLEAYPNNDGRGIVVAIFDTGTDPGAEGLLITSDGKPKIVDVLDTTGSGDVNTTKVITMAEIAKNNNTLTGLSGRTLTLNSDWKNPSGDFHIGVKLAFDVFPKKLQNRVKAQRAKLVNEQHNAHVASLHSQLASVDNPTSEAGKTQIKLLKGLLKAAIEQHSSYVDAGPVLDVLVWFDGEVWQTIVDTRETGDLTGYEPMCDYRLKRQYRPISELDLMNFSVNVYEEGNIVSLVVTAGAHGTHVAGIVGAHYPESPEQDGIAPGVQLISVKIGDSRLGSMETGPGLIRACAHLMRFPCDLVNLSYGEAISVPDTGRICNTIRELVTEHDIIFISSAGNAGPALTTVGAPGGSTKDIISVGAYVSKPMQKDLYIQAEKTPEQMYTWSSRGPCADGDLGVSITACGGAITSVPAWTLTGKQLMNGTSMSSPATCGAFALLLSGLKQEKMTYSPYRVRRAVENTARLVPSISRFGQGNGLLQVQNAYEHLLAYKDTKFADLRYDVSVSGPCKRGIYLRQYHEVTGLSNHNVSVVPKWKTMAANADEKAITAYTRGRLSYEKTLKLSIVADGKDSSWLTVPEEVLLTSAGRGFNLKIDPRALVPGVYFAWVVGSDPLAGNTYGPLFRVPVTVVVPFAPQPVLEHTLQATASGKLDRLFVSVPQGATWVKMTVTPTLPEGAESVPVKAMVHSVMLAPQIPYRDIASNKFTSLKHQEPFIMQQVVQGGFTLELCIAQYWSAAGTTACAVKVEFRGIHTHSTTVSSGSVLALRSGEVTCFDAQALVVPELLLPVLKLTGARTPKRPASYSITPMGARDTLSRGRKVYQMILTYTWEQKVAGKIVIRAPLLNNVLYEAEFGSQLWMLFNKNKKHLGSGDCWPDKVSIGKGTHTLRLQVKHDDRKKLEALTNLKIYLEETLKTAVTVPVHTSFRDAVVNGAKIRAQRLPVGKYIQLYTGVVKAPATVTSDETLLFGTLVLEKKGEYVRPKGFPVTMTLFKDAHKSKETAPVLKTHQYVTPTPAATAADGDVKTTDTTTYVGEVFDVVLKVVEEEGKKKKKKEDEEKAKTTPAEELRDLQIKYVLGITDAVKQQQAFDLVQPALIATFPQHLPLLSLALSVAEASAGKDATKAALVVSRAEKLLTEIDTTVLASHFMLAGEQTETAEFKKLDKKHKETRTVLVSTLLSKLSALKLIDTDDLKDFTSTWNALATWGGKTLTKPQKKLKNTLARYYDGKRGRVDAVYTSLVAELKDTPSKSLELELIQQLKSMGPDFARWAELREGLLCVNYPEQYQMH